MGDNKLLSRVADGDVQAFEALYQRHHTRAYSLAVRITGRPAAAEEAVQDAFMELWRGAAGFDAERGSVSTWLLSFVRYRSLDAVRRNALRTHQDIDTVAAGLEAPERTEELVVRSDEFARTRRLVAALPPDQREVIDLAYFRGFTQNEIAVRVGVPLGTVKGRARLALAKLRQAA